MPEKMSIETIKGQFQEHLRQHPYNCDHISQKNPESSRLIQDKFKQFHQNMNQLLEQ